MISSSSSDSDLSTFARRARDEHPRDARLAAELAVVLARSGHWFVPDAGDTADVASTGGPSSLSTLICPLILRSAGLSVPKLGVPGRPAGGIDCLAQIPGYSTHLDDESLHRVLAEAGYAHFLASGRYAPLDARLFVVRQRDGCQEVPTLVAASLLAKKLAVGVRLAGLDIRAAEHGNFGKTLDEARLNAELFVSAASELGIEGHPVVSDGRRPYQPFIGRGEALVALKHLFQGTGGAWLDGHVDLCLELCRAAAPNFANRFRADPKALYEFFSLNVEAQGGSLTAYERKVSLVEDEHRHEVRAARDGFLRVDLGCLRRTLVSAQERAAASGPFPDPMGVILMAGPGDAVAAGEPLATVRIEGDERVEAVLEELAAALVVEADSVQQ